MPRTERQIKLKSTDLKQFLETGGHRIWKIVSRNKGLNSQFENIASFSSDTTIATGKYKLCKDDGISNGDSKQSIEDQCFN